MNTNLKHEIFINNFFIDLLVNHIIIKNTDEYAEMVLMLIREVVLNTQKQDHLSPVEKNRLLHKSIREVPQIIIDNIHGSVNDDGDNADGNANSNADVDADAKKKLNQILRCYKDKININNLKKF